MYKVKEDGLEGLRLKSRDILHGNRDRYRFGVRRDSASADLSVVRLLLSLGVNLGFDFGTAEVKGTNLQSGPRNSDIYVQPPKEYVKNELANSRSRRVLWKLSKLSYGIVESGRQWLCGIEDWMEEVSDLDRVPGVEQIFVKRQRDRKVAYSWSRLSTFSWYADSLQK